MHTSYKLYHIRKIKPHLKHSLSANPTNKELRISLHVVLVALRASLNAVLFVKYL